MMKIMHIGGLYVNQLKLVEAIFRSGNLTEAAEEVGLSQSAASHALARLRKDFGDQIFVRTAEGMQPTPFGRRLIDSASDVLRVLYSGLKHPDFDPRTSRRTFKVILSDVSQFLYLPRILGRLSAEAPGVVLRVRPVPMKAPHLLFESGEVDLAVGTFTRLIVGCRQQRLYRERYTCVVRNNHPLFRRGMSAEAFSKVEQAIVDPRGYVHEQLDNLLTQQKLLRRGKLHSPYFLSLLPVIADSDLLVVMAGRLAAAFAELAPLQLMTPPAKLPTYNVTLFWHERFHRDPANEWLRGLFVDLFSDAKRRS